MQDGMRFEGYYEFEVFSLQQKLFYEKDNHFYRLLLDIFRVLYFSS